MNAEQNAFRPAIWSQQTYLRSRAAAAKRRTVAIELPVGRHAGLEGVRLHDLRHTYASFGAGGGLGLPIIGKLLGHTQASTTQRYAHLDADPLRRASEAIGGRLAAALDGKRAGSVVQLKGGRRH